MAAQNCEGETILHELHSKILSTRSVIIIDEMSMVSLRMWALLATMQFMGNIFVCMGDPDGQFLPISDQHWHEQLEGIDRSDFMHTLCRGLRVELHKFRRGGDMDHYVFVGGISLKYGISLEDALDEARERYPACGNMFEGTTLVVDHRCRILVNSTVNRWQSAFHEHIVIEAGPVTRGMANILQDMRIWQGIVLMAVCKSTDAMLRNGLRCQVADWDADKAPGGDAKVRLSRLGDDAQLISEPFEVGRDVVAEKLHLTHALCYFSVQARTIRGPLRLAQTDHEHFTLRHLIVGLGRAPDGSCVEVE